MGSGFVYLMSVVGIDVYSKEVWMIVVFDFEREYFFVYCIGVCCIVDCWIKESIFWEEWSMVDIIDIGKYIMIFGKVVV